MENLLCNSLDSDDFCSTFRLHYPHIVPRRRFYDTVCCIVAPTKYLSLENVLWQEHSSCLTGNEYGSLELEIKQVYKYIIIMIYILILYFILFLYTGVEVPFPSGLTGYGLNEEISSSIFQDDWDGPLQWSLKGIPKCWILSITSSLFKKVATLMQC